MRGSKVVLVSTASFEETKAYWLKSSLERYKDMIFFDGTGYRYTLFRKTKVVTNIGNRHDMKIGDRITIFRFAKESPDLTKKYSYTVEVIEIKESFGIILLQGDVELCPRLPPALRFPESGQEYFQAKVPEGSQFPCFEKGIISKCDISIQLGTTQCDIEGAEGCGLYAANEYCLIGICVRHEKDEGDQPGGGSNSSTYTTHIAPVFSFY